MKRLAQVLSSTPIISEISARFFRSQGWSIGVISLLLPLSLLPLLPGTAMSQLTPAIWTERVEFFLDGNQLTFFGPDELLPDPISHSLSEKGCFMMGNVSFGPPGPPQITVHTEAHWVSVTPVTYAYVQTISEAIFQIRVKQRSPAPFPVTQVPVIITVKGTTEVQSSPFYGASALATSTFHIADEGVLLRVSIATNLNGPHSASFDSTATLLMTPDNVFVGWVSVVAHANVTRGNTEDFVSADAFIDPSFEIDPNLIPGTEWRYSDYFEMEYSLGYWALGEPTPAHPSTWGAIKARYTDD